MSSRWKHQEREWKHRGAKARAWLWTMRTGKSRQAIENACFLYQALEIDGVIIVAPNGVHYNWIKLELPKYCDVPSTVFAWRFSKPDNAIQFDSFMSNISGLPWFTVNTESVIRSEVQKAIRTFIKRYPRFLLVVDESHQFAVPGAKRTSYARALARKATYRRILTGTPVENSPLQAFSQYELLEKEALGFARYADFCQHYATFERLRGTGGREFNKISGYINQRELKDRMAPYTSVVLRSDCEDMPEVQFDQRLVGFLPAQREAWEAIKEQSIEFAEKHGFKDVFSGGAALVKLQQVEGGYLKTPSGDLQMFGSLKMHVLIDELVSYSSPVVAWFQYTHEIDAAVVAARNIGFKVEPYHGKIGQRQREKTLEDFAAGKLDGLFGQPMAGGQGRDMSAAGMTLWYSQTPDAMWRNQANERATKVGGKVKMIVDIMISGGVDEYFRQLTERKTTVADDVSRFGLRAILNELKGD